jgi:hypothetical protein
MLSRAIRAGVAALAVVTTLAGAVACGAPEFTYVKNSGEKTYFKVPHAWHKISEQDLDDLLIDEPAGSAVADLRRALSWSTAYDASAEPSATHLLSGQTTDDPIVYARILRLTATQRDAISLDALRNAFGLPVTDDARLATAEQGGLTGFEALRDDVLTPSANIHGVRVVYNYLLPGGVLHTFDQTAYVNNAGDRLYLMVLRCSATCYKDRVDEFDKIATSFTVRNRS